MGQLSSLLRPLIQPLGSIQTATATFGCPLVLPNPPNVAGTCYPGSEASSLLSTITVYNEGLNTTNWLVTAPSATDGTAPAGNPPANPPATVIQDVIHCGPGWAANGGSGGSVCVSTYPSSPAVSVVLTAPTQAGVNFGGWSSSCTPATKTACRFPPQGPIGPQPGRIIA